MTEYYFNEINKGCPDWLIGDPDYQPRKNKTPSEQYQGVIQLKPDGVEVARFLSTRAAADAVNVHIQNIRQAIRDKRISAGYLWVAITDENRHVQPQA